jgi:hypothetical protein
MPIPLLFLEAVVSAVFLYGVFLLQRGVRWVGSHAGLELYIC